MGLFSRKEQENFVINPHEEGEEKMYFVVLYCQVKGFEKSVYLEELRKNKKLALNYEKVIYDGVEKMKLTVYSSSKWEIQGISDTAGLPLYDLGMRPVY